MMDERGLRLRGLLALAAGVGVLAYVVLLWWYRRGGTLPPVSWTAALLLFLVAGLCAGAGLRIRATRRGRAAKPMHPLGVFRMLRFAQASALVGALAAGWYLALAGVTVPDVDAAALRDIGLSAGLAALASAAVVAAGLWVQAQCRVDPPDGVDDPLTGPGERS